MVFKHILCGGTFDRLHKGHKAFLQFAFSKGQHVTIGLTSDSYIKKYKAVKDIQSFQERKKELVDFLREENLLTKATIISIDNPFDETLTRDDATALVVSSETYENGKEINCMRKEKNLPELPLVVFPIVMAVNGDRISSTNIRKGIITKQGEIISKQQLPSRTIFVSSVLRELLHKPFGTLLYRDIPEEYLRAPERLVTVGDVTTKRIHDMGIQQKLSVVDFSVERKRAYKDISDLGFSGKELVLKVENPAGQLQYGVWQIFADAVAHLREKQNIIIVVTGEEDLLAIPLVLLLPVGFVILYGQPQEGVVAVEITAELQEKIRTIVLQLV